LDIGYWSGKSKDCTRDSYSDCQEVGERNISVMDNLTAKRKFQT